MMKEAERWLNPEKNTIDYSFYRSLLAKLLELIKNHYENKLISLVLYGSVARGTAKKESSEFISIKKSGYSPEVKPILFSKEEASESRYIFLDIVNDGIILYDKNDFFKKRLEKLMRNADVKCGK